MLYLSPCYTPYTSKYNTRFGSPQHISSTIVSKMNSVELTAVGLSQNDADKLFNMLLHSLFLQTQKNKRNVIIKEQIYKLI